MMKNETSKAGGPTREAVQSQINTPQRILVVDDDVDIRQLSTEVLRESGYHVDNAADGKVAWHALKSHHYDLLITDHNMPLMTGLELIKALRAKDMKLPVILMSGTMPTEELNRHPWLEIQATLLKPYTLAELFTTVKEALYVHDTAYGQFAPPANCQKPAAPGGLRL